MAMIRHRARVAPRAPCTLLYSSRTPDDVIYAAELDAARRARRRPARRPHVHSRPAARLDGLRATHRYGDDRRRARDDRAHGAGVRVRPDTRWSSRPPKPWSGLGLAPGQVEDRALRSERRLTMTTTGRPTTSRTTPTAWMPTRSRACSHEIFGSEMTGGHESLWPLRQPRPGRHACVPTASTVRASSCAARSAQRS